MPMTRSTKRSHLPKIGRSPKSVKFVVTERDLSVLDALGRYRYLRTGQIARLIFPQSKTVQSARRRLKYLYHAGYVGRIQPLIDSALGQSEMAYYLEPSGASLLDQDTLPKFSRKGTVKPMFLRHALAVSEFRLNLELAVQDLPEISLHRAIMDHELKSHTENAVGKRRYRLFDEVLDPIGRRNLVVHPDMMFVLKAQTDQGKTFQRLFFVEIDRGTEGLRVIEDKLIGYHLYQREGVFRKFGDFDRFRVLFQTNSDRRKSNICDLASRFSDQLDTWVSSEQEVDGGSVLTSPIWSASDSDLRVSMIKPTANSAPQETSE